MSYQDDNYRDNPADSRDDRDRYDDRYQDDREREDRQRVSYPGQPPNRGCSKGCLYGLAGCGCLSVLVVVAMGFFGWQAFNLFKKGFSVDPVVVRAATQEMAEINPPAKLQPKVKMDLMVAKIVVYQSNDGKSTLSLIQVNPQFAQQGQGQNREIGKGFRKGFGEGSKDLKQQEFKIEKSELKDVTIRGQVCKVTFSEAKNSNDEEYRILDGEFQGKAGPVEFQLQEPLEDYDEAEVIKFLESIK